MQAKSKLTVNPNQLTDTNYSEKKKTKLVASVNVAVLKINERDYSEVRTEIGRIVTDGIDFIGMKFPKDNVCKKIGEFVYKDYGFLTFAELEEAFDMVIRGEIDIENMQYQTFSVKTINDILKVYTFRKRQKEYQNVKKAEPIYDTNRGERDFIRLIMDSFEQYKATDTIQYIYAAPAIYDYLDKKGLVQFSVEQKRTLFDNATAIFRAEGKAELDKASPFNKIVLSLETEHIRIKGIAKRLALFEYYKKLKTDGMNLPL